MSDIDTSTVTVHLYDARNYDSPLVVFESRGVPRMGETLDFTWGDRHYVGFVVNVEWHYNLDDGYEAQNIIVVIRMKN